MKSSRLGQLERHIVPVMLDPEASVVPGMEYAQSIVAYNDPAGWTMQVSDAINHVIRWWIALHQQTANASEAKRVATRAATDHSLLKSIAGGVVGVGVASILIGALTKLVED